MRIITTTFVCVFIATIMSCATTCSEDTGNNDGLFFKQRNIDYSVLICKITKDYHKLISGIENTVFSNPENITESLKKLKSPNPFINIRLVKKVREVLSDE